MWVGRGCKASGLMWCVLLQTPKNRAMLLLQPVGAKYPPGPNTIVNHHNATTDDLCMIKTQHSLKRRCKAGLLNVGLLTKLIFWMISRSIKLLQDSGKEHPKVFKCILSRHFRQEVLLLKLYSVFCIFVLLKDEFLYLRFCDSFCESLNIHMNTSVQIQSL